MNIRRQPQFIPYLNLVIGTICIGWSAIFVKLAGVNGVVSAFYRVLIALLILFPIWVYKRHKLPSTKDLLLIILGGFLFGMDLTYWNVSILLSTAGTATVLANFAPVWVALGAVIFFKSKLNYWFWLGTIISIAGIITIIGWQQVEQFNLGKGNLYALIASLFYAAYLLVTQQSRTKVDTLTFMVFATLGSAITLFCSAALQHISLVVPQESIIWLVGLGLLTHVAGWLTINYALGYIESAVASVTLLSQAVWTTLFAIPVLGEVLSIHQLIGGGIVLVGILIVNLKR